MGTEAWQKERWRTGSHICWSAEGGHRGSQRLLAGSDGWQGWLEKESHGVDWGRSSSSSSSIATEAPEVAWQSNTILPEWTNFARLFVKCCLVTSQFVGVCRKSHHVYQWNWPRPFLEQPKYTRIGLGGCSLGVYPCRDCTVGRKRNAECGCMPCSLLLDLYVESSYLVI